MEQRDQLVCPLCNDKVDRLIYRFHLENEKVVIGKIKTDHPEWSIEDGLCSRCVDYYHSAILRDQMILPEIGPYFPIKSADDFIILPTGLRLDTDPRYTGKGVTICFIDSGFSLHPDLLGNPSRIKLMLDLTADTQEDNIGNENISASWHGTMTTVVCAGSGLLSRGLYRGIASDASLVLLKVQDSKGKIQDAYLIRALEWLLQNHQKYGIRIVNISLGADQQDPWRESRIDRLAEQLIAEGVNIISAAGNDDARGIFPPANSPNVIAVGGINDSNRLGNDQVTNYHSSFGHTEEGISKPELVAHAIWIAAPIVHNTEEHEEAINLFAQLQAHQIPTQMEVAERKEESLHYRNEHRSIAEELIQKIQEKKYISSHYMHVDGTSFAAPIVSSVVAQMLEADPELTPMHIRSILFNSAKRLPGIAAERQGFGMVRPRLALLQVLKTGGQEPITGGPEVDLLQRTITFSVNCACAERVSLAGNFNRWEKDLLLLDPCANGTWKITIPVLPPGKYLYKFFTDTNGWLEDINNPYREPDGFNGFNSLLTIDTEYKK